MIKTCTVALIINYYDKIIKKAMGVSSRIIIGESYRISHPLVNKY